MDEVQLKRKFTLETIDELRILQIDKLIKDNAKLKVQLEDQSILLRGVYSSSKRTTSELDKDKQESSKRWKKNDFDNEVREPVEVQKWTRYTPRDYKEYADYIAEQRLCMYDLTGHYQIESTSKRTGRPMNLHCAIVHENPSVIHVKDLKKRDIKYSKHAALCLACDQFGYGSNNQGLVSKLCASIVEDKDGFFSSSIAPLG